ncbi:nicotinate phosphoribosyltransferase [Thermomonospora curvata]|uniref:Nicotinate phosphoribosyltransferase n=1 Tax=Thermomonospora curvata (strain ATCC 19995 / DSM 43183 / JCM 3096 / KCTC 9072 / NBRC 15933 / NCIMB 10081 / Henssen B9) TaxID=471852 RepID=D1AD96_THECD|nr:nicotinate phosphoribosyltransferase [Thermomonospora curvata DSM 43183]PKK12451.1 MAG: nicotinate phosphoribosyltransferase [Thermomonospora sp. CIF 1]
MVHTPVRSLPLVDLGYSTALLTDHYELTMLQAALRSGTAGRRAVFEVFARRLPAGRRYGVVAGVGRLLEMIEQFRFGERELEFLTSRGVVDESTAQWLAGYRFSGDIHGYPEGECYFPGSPILTVEAPFGEAVLLETLVLSVLNHDSAIASAASRMVNAAGGRPLIEMGSRRTHEAAGVAAARAAYVAGFATTSNLEAGRRYGIPTAGTSAHAFTLLHDSERHAFQSQLESLGEGTTLLVDTYDVERAVRTAVELAGPRLGAVRIDSGDLAVAAGRVRALLDSLGARDTRIVVTGDLDEHGIAALAAAPADAYGVGTALVTGSGAPTAALVYKMVARADSPDPDAPLRPVAKRSVGKPTRGGRKTAVRRLDAHGVACAEVVSTGELPAGPRDRLLPVPLVRGGEVVGREPLEAARERHAAALRELPATALQLSDGEPAIPTEFIDEIVFP